MGLDYSTQSEHQPKFIERVSNETKRTPLQLKIAGALGALAFVSMSAAVYEGVGALQLDAAVKQYGLPESSQIVEYRDQKLEQTRTFAGAGAASLILGSVVYFYRRPEDK